MGLNIGLFIKKDCLTMRLNGDLDDKSVTELRMKIIGYIDQYNIKHLVINMKNLDFMDSSGIGFIIGRYHQLKKNGGDITLTDISYKIERIIKLSGLTKICIIRETEKVI